MKKHINFLLASFFPLSIVAHHSSDISNEVDSIQLQNLKEVVIISKSTKGQLNEVKNLGSLDEHLEQSGSINMIKRGAYAWEPMLNGMNSERSIVTIDGMRIYEACTDKMDPVTSYVETTNLSAADIKEGQSGSEHGGSIAGSINLVRKKTGFKDKGIEVGLFTGFETVNRQKIGGIDLGYSTETFYINTDFTFRDAHNYKAGGKEVIDYSQFRKYNFSAISGYKIDQHQSLEASVIFDKATDVGYPALPMDVSLAQATIASFQYKYEHLNDYLHSWETKLYFNDVTHVMDDTKRPVVPIRMDMPGWSRTYGGYSKLEGQYKRHHFSGMLSSHHNNSLAEMTMYPNDPNENDMFMLTWPDINTFFTGLNIADQIQLNKNLLLNLSLGLGVHHNQIDSELGLQSLRIFYPELEAQKNRFLKNGNALLSVQQNEQFNYFFGLGYGERAPSISEAYGFYLFNSNDVYDYIGNPYLNNEKSMNASIGAQFKNDHFRIKLKGNYFHIMDYIIGKPDVTLSAMNIVAKGVKVYEALEFARILNTEISMDYHISKAFSWYAQASYRYGKDFELNNLPLIQPFHYLSSLKYQHKDIESRIYINGSAAYKQFSIEYGETAKSAYTILNWDITKIWSFKRNDLIVRLGVENIFDQYYMTFSDWNNIPRAGRNFFINATFSW